MSINKEFKFIFYPKQKGIYDKVVFAIGGKSLHKYIGEANAETVIKKAIESTEDKLKIKFRKHGVIYIYVK